MKHFYNKQDDEGNKETIVSSKKNTEKSFIGNNNSNNNTKTNIQCRRKFMSIDRELDWYPGDAEKIINNRIGEFREFLFDKNFKTREAYVNENPFFVENRIRVWEEYCTVCEKIGMEVLLFPELGD